MELPLDSILFFQMFQASHMAYLQKKNIAQQIIYSRGAVLVLVFLCVFVGYSVVSLMGKSRDAAKSRRLSEAEASELQAKQADLSMKLEALKTTEGKEAALREQFPVVSPGEGVVVITEESQAKNMQEVNAEKSGGFWHFLKTLFSKE